jgi:integration host factor subunit beta
VHFRIVEGLPALAGEDTAQGLAMATVTKRELIDRIAERTGNKRVVVKRIIQNFLDEMASELSRANRLEFRDFGVFEVKERAPRVAQNPKTMQKVEIPARPTVRFKVGRMLKTKIDDHAVPMVARAKRPLRAVPPHIPQRVALQPPPAQA